MFGKQATVDVPNQRGAVIIGLVGPDSTERSEVKKHNMSCCGVRPHIMWCLTTLRHTLTGLMMLMETCFTSNQLAP